MSETSDKILTALVQAEFECPRCGGPHVTTAFARVNKGVIVGPAEKMQGSPTSEIACGECRRKENREIRQKSRKPKMRLVGGEK